MEEFQSLSIGCKATLILAIISTVMLVAGRRWPQLSTVWKRVGIVTLLVLPFVGWGLPAITIPILPPADVVVAIPANPLVGATTTPIDARPAVSLIDQPSESEVSYSGWQPFVDPSFLEETKPIDFVAPTNTAAASTNTTSMETFAGIPAPVVPMRDRSATRIEHSFPQRQNPQIGIAAAYGLVFIVLLVRLIGAWRGLVQLKRASVPVTETGWQHLMQRWIAEMRIRRPVELRASDDVSVPMTFGWISCIILVPRNCLRECDPVQREAILIHELTHIARNDFLWQILLQLTASIYWAHPLAWFVRRESEALRERLCDQLCSQFLGRDVYAQALVQIAARSIHRPHAGIGIAMAQRSSLRRRLSDLDRTQLPRGSQSGRASHSFVVATAIFTLGLIVTCILTRQDPVPIADKSSNAIVEERPISTPEATIGSTVTVTFSDGLTSTAQLVSESTNGPIVSEPGIGLFETVTTDVVIASNAVGNPGTLTVADAVIQNNPITYNIVNGSYGLFVEAADGTTASNVSLANNSIFGGIQVKGAGAAIGDGMIFVQSGSALLSGEPEPKSPPQPWNIDDIDQASIHEQDADEKTVEWADDTEEFNAQTAATVNGEPVLNGEVLDPFAFHLMSTRERMLKMVNNPKHRPSGQPVPTFADYEKFRRKCIQMAITPYVQKKILVQRLLANSTPEQKFQMSEHVDEQFNKELENLKRNQNVSTIEELEIVLQKKGTSIKKVKVNFALEHLTGECIAIHRPRPDITDDSILEYYKAHLDKFKVTAEFTWQKICIDISQEYDRSEAKKLLGKIQESLHAGEEPAQVVSRFSLPANQIIHDTIPSAGAGVKAPSGFGVRINRPNASSILVQSREPMSNINLSQGTTFTASAPTHKLNQFGIVKTTKVHGKETVSFELTPAAQEAPRFLTGNDVTLVNLADTNTVVLSQNITQPAQHDNVYLQVSSVQPKATQVPDSALSLRRYESMTKGGLADKELEVQVLSMPLNQWSQVIERPSCLCVIRVSERTDERLKPLDEVKEEIRKRLFEEIVAKDTREFTEKVFSSAKIESEYTISIPTRGSKADIDKKTSESRNSPAQD